MAVQKHARDILFFELSVSRRAIQAPFPKLRELIPLWQQAKDEDDFPCKEWEKGTVTALIKDVEVDIAQEIATLLIEVSDKNAPNSTYLNHDKRTSRHIKKEKPEGNGFSAHIFMSLREEDGKANTYLTLVEAIPAVSIGRIQSVLNTALRHICSDIDGSPFTYIKPGGGRKVEDYVPHIVLAGCPSEQFYKDIEEGRINGLRLVAPTTHESLGQGKYLQMDELSVSVKVSRDIPKGERFDTILTGAKAKVKQYPTARIYIQPEEGGKSFSVDVDVATGAIIGEAYVKTRRLSGFEPLLDTSAAEEIVPHFAAKVKALLVRERDDG